MTPKICSRCKQPKPASDFHRRTAAKDGLQSICKPCTTDLGRARSGTRTVRVRGSLRPYAENWAEGGRRCTKCQKWKVWKSFYRKANGYNGRSARCRDCQQRAASGKRTAAAPVGRLVVALDAKPSSYHRRGTHPPCAICADQPGAVIPDLGPQAQTAPPPLCEPCHALVRALQTPGQLDAARAYLHDHQPVGDKDDEHHRNTRPAPAA